MRMLNANRLKARITVSYQILAKVQLSRQHLGGFEFYASQPLHFISNLRTESHIYKDSAKQNYEWTTSYMALSFCRRGLLASM